MASKKEKRQKPQYQMMRARKPSYEEFKKIAESQRTSIVNVIDDALALLKESLGVPMM